MKTLDDALALGSLMQRIGEHRGRRVAVVLTDMDTPLGLTVGNALEVREAIATLRGGGPADLRELCLTLAEQVLAASGVDIERRTIASALDGGRAFERFRMWIATQGGDVRAIDDLELAPDRHVVEAESAGFLAALDALAVGRASGLLGGGRARKGDEIDLGVGVELHAKPGDPIEVGQPLATLVHRGGRGLEEATALVAGAAEIAASADPKPLIYEILSAN